MTHPFPIALALFAAAAGRAQEPTSRAADAPPLVTYVSSPRIVVSPQVDATTSVQRIELWSSRDGRRSWRLAATATDVRRVEYEAPEDGRYDLFIRLINEAGASAVVPEAGAMPTASVVVDTIPPLLQLHDARAALAADGDSVIAVRLSVFDENLGPDGVRLFYRTAGEPAWRDGGTLRPVEGRSEWRPPTDAAATLDLRIVAADRAGNLAGDEASNVRLARPNLDVTTQPANRPLDSRATAPIHDAAGIPVPPPMPGAPTAYIRPPPAPSDELPLHTRAIHAANETRRDPQPAANTVDPGAAIGPAAPAAYERVARLRTAADRHLRAGEHALASARLDDALRAAPADLETLVQYAGVLTTTGDLAAAAQRYEQAHEIAPQDPRVLDGLAAVAAGRGEFGVARQHLLKLIEVTPQAGRAWLHYGDVEHRLGRATDAVTAWRRAQEMATDAEVRASAQRRLKLLGPDRAP